MHSNTLENAASRFPWPTLFKVTASSVFAFGIFIHMTRLIVGIDDVVRYVMTPPVDIAFAFAVLSAAVPGTMAWRRYSGGRAGRIAYGFMMFMLYISLPIHFSTVVTWSTDKLLAFPTWYSAIEVPMFLALSITAARLKFDGA